MASQPGKGALHHPPPGQNLEMMQLATLDNLQDPTAKLLSPRNELASVSCVSPDQLQAPKAVFRLLEHHPGPIPALDVSGMHHHGHHQPHCVHHKMALAPAHFLGCIVAAWPPFSVALTLWLSIIAALGVAWRPLCFRTCSRKAFITRSQVPSKRQRRA